MPRRTTRTNPAPAPAPTRPGRRAGPRWRRLPEERPRQILDAALAVFGERGLAGARLDDIARRAGVSKGTIYLYFANKEELFRDVVRAIVVDRLREAAAKAGEGSPIDELKRYLRAHWDFVRSPEFQTIFKLVTGELHNFPELAEFYGREVVMPANQLMAGMIRRGIERGDFRPVDPIMAARFMSSTAMTHSTWCARRHVFKLLTDVTDDQVFEGLSDFFFHAIRATPPSRAPEPPVPQ
jgi:TetR/AcrR family transcriptional regulator